MCFLLISLALTVAQPAPESTMFEGLLDRLPQAAPREFATPDAVVREYFEAIINNQVERTFKCVPLRAQYVAASFEAEVTRLGAYSPTSTSPPEDHYSRFMEVLQGHHATVKFLRYLLLAKADREAAEALNSVTSAELVDGKVDPQWVKRMAEVLSLQKLSKYEIKTLTSEPCPSKPSGFGGVTISEAAFVHVVIAKGDIEIQQELLVGKVGENFQILRFPSLPSGFRGSP
ncbi:MAG: hypothetical protein ISS78_09985 [Phycisphaerae bacterium]|nr:hypothetical protein [Phycisphaerae bacterium]